MTAAFAEDPVKIAQWDAFVADVAYQPGTLAEVIKNLAAFLMPQAAAAKKFQADGSESRFRSV